MVSDVIAISSHKKHKETGDGQSYLCAVIRVSASRLEKYGHCFDPADCDDESGS